MTIIGIDLGTTNSLVAVLDGDHPRVLANELGDRITPSAVAIAKDGTTLVGRAAKDRLISDPSSGIAHFKRDMGSEKTYRFGKRDWSPVECSALMLKELKRVAEQALGVSITEAVIAVPAYFHEAPRTATIQAAELAGLTVERLINEPTAAALAYGCQNQDADANMLVFDLGGGTFDVTVLEIFEGIIDVKASGGISKLGGEDYLDQLVAELSNRFDVKPESTAYAKLRPLAETLKRELSTHQEADITWNDHTQSISQHDFQTCTENLTNQIKPVLVRCLRDAGMQFKDVENVILVGGASRMHVIHTLINNLQPQQTLDHIDPDMVVAEGAAWQAGLIAKDEAVKEVVLTDVCPHSLGVETTKELPGGRFESGLYSPIIDRNTTLPISRSDIFHTLTADQNDMTLEIYQGEHRKVENNHHLGKLSIKGVRGKAKDDASGQVEVRFTYDMNGVLEVDARALATNKTASVVIEQRPGLLSKKELKAIRERLRPLKIHPRDKLPNRARLERAYRLYTDLLGPTREQLAHYLDDFEAALNSQDEEKIRISARLIDQFLDYFYQEEQSRLAPQGGDDGDKAS